MVQKYTDPVRQYMSCEQALALNKSINRDIYLYTCLIPRQCWSSVGV